MTALFWWGGLSVHVFQLKLFQLVINQFKKRKGWRKKEYCRLGETVLHWKPEIHSASRGQLEEIINFFSQEFTHEKSSNTFFFLSVALSSYFVCLFSQS